VLHPSTHFLLERWNAGCRTAMQLFRELQPRGYTGSYRRVAAYASRLRQAQGLPPRRQGRRQTLPVVAEPASPPLTPRRATWLVLGREDKRAAAETQQLAQLHAQDPAVAEAIDLAQDFTTLVRQRQPERLDPWLQRAATSTLEALQRFATGLYEDYNAVKAGVTMPWSNGPVEGHINRLKMLKRQMFGRAHLDLLNRRFLLAPRHERARVSHAEAAAAARAPPAAASHADQWRAHGLSEGRQAEGKRPGEPKTSRAHAEGDERAPTSALQRRVGLARGRMDALPHVPTNGSMFSHRTRRRRRGHGACLRVRDPGSTRGAAVVLAAEGPQTVLHPLHHKWA